jgi:hypothetical protein
LAVLSLEPAASADNASLAAADMAPFRVMEASIADIQNAILTRQLTTEQVVNHLRVELQRLARRFDEVRVKGKQEPLVIYDLLWRQDTVTSLFTGVFVGARNASLLRLRYADKTFLIRAPSAGFSIGRDPVNSLVVVASPVSRSHATIEFTRGKFVLVDTSTNSAYVLTHDQQTLYLRREHCLWGHGLIGLGALARKIPTWYITNAGLRKLLRPHSWLQDHVLDAGWVFILMRHFHPLPMCPGWKPARVRHYDDFSILGLRPLAGGFGACD